MWPRGSSVCHVEGGVGKQSLVYKTASPLGKPPREAFPRDPGQPLRLRLCSPHPPGFTRPLRASVPLCVDTHLICQFSVCDLPVPCYYGS